MGVCFNVSERAADAKLAQQWVQDLGWVSLQNARVQGSGFEFRFRQQWAAQHPQIHLRLIRSSCQSSLCRSCSVMASSLPQAGH